MWLAQTTYTYTTVDTTNAAVGGGFWAAMAAMWLVWLVVLVVAIVAMWKIFAKAGQPGWAAIIPIYNIYITLKIVGRPGWWVLLYFIPLVQIVVSLVVSIDLAKSFGKSDLFGVVGLWLFSLIGYLMLAFGSAKYVGPSVAGSGGAPSSHAPTPTAA